MTKNFHFIGIGGVGMSSLAEMLLQKGYNVSGSDLKNSLRVERLKKKGAHIELGHKEEHIKTGVDVVITTDIKEDNPEWIAAKKFAEKIWHRSELLAELMEGKKALLIAGAHGKTTTSALLAHVLYCAKKHPSFSIGGEIFSLPSHGYLDTGEYFVAEADESDGSFLRYRGFGAIITNVEEEHMNYWKTFSALKKGFLEFAHNVASKEHLFLCSEDPFLATYPGVHYGFKKMADFRAENIVKKEMLTFDIAYKDRLYAEVKIPLLGHHNVLNALAVFGMALQLGIHENAIREAFKSFQGVKRRCEKIGVDKNVWFYDDYAHHPTEIKATLQALRMEVGSRKILALFQPHRFSRVESLFNQFLSAFDYVDTLFVFDIYGAGEKSMDPHLSEKLFEALAKTSKAKKVVFVTKNQFLEKYIDFQKGDVVITLGAGDITDFGKKVFEDWKQHGL